MSEPIQPLVISTHDVLHPDGKRFFLDDSMFPVDDEGMYYPRFSVQEASKTFFGQGPDWLRWRMRPEKPSRRTGDSKHPDGFFLLDGKPLEFKRLAVPPTSKKYGDPNAVTARYYTLADIERMAHALAQQGIIDGLRLANIMVIVRCCARLYGVEQVPPIVAEESNHTTEETSP